MKHATFEPLQRDPFLVDNVDLYGDLQRSEAFLAQGQRVSHTGTFGWSFGNDRFYWSE
jgi:hypothetical protein